MALWCVSLIEMILVLMAAVCFMSWPPLFRVYYPIFGEATHARDAAAIVEWLSSQSDSATLTSSLASGPLSKKELKHYADVRGVMQNLRAALWISIAIAVGLLAFGRPSAHLFEAAQWRALWILSGVFAAIALFAALDWETLFAWLHRPFFGATSWKLSNSAYSLRLFPIEFWRGVGALTFAIPAASFLLAAIVFRASRSFRRSPRDARIPSALPTR